MDKIEKKFTPGPWKIEEDNLGCKNIIGNVVFEEDSEAQEIFVCSDIGYTTGLADERQDLANAHLIAEAPKLLRVLEHVRHVIENSDHWWMDCPDKGGFDLEEIKDTISKALGAEGI